MNPGLRFCKAVLWLAVACGLLGVWGGWQAYGESGAGAWGALDGEGSALAFDDGFGKGEAEACAGGWGGLASVEAFEDVVQIGRRDSGAVVGDVDSGFQGALLCLYGDLASLGCVIQGIFQDVSEGFCGPAGITVQVFGEGLREDYFLFFRGEAPGERLQGVGQQI